MIQQTAKLDQQRYSKYILAEPALGEQLKNFLREDAWTVFESKAYDDLEKLISISGTSPKGYGIYLLILWLENESHLYKYIGQSQETETRIQNRNDPAYRKCNPSFHYYVWEQLGPDVNSVWVMLSTPKFTVDPLSLNLLEMWSSLVFQTLPKQTLSKYLLGETFSPNAGRHLNVASPLHQSTQSHGPAANSLGDLYSSDDPIANEYYRKRQKEYLELRHSEDPLLRDFWWENRNRADETRYKTAKKFLAGTLVKVRFYKERKANHASQVILIAGITSKINHSFVKLDQSQELHVQCVITDEPDNDCFARDSRPSDEASRVVIRIRSTNIEGKAFDAIPCVGGEVNVFKMNTVYDVLVRRNFNETRQLGRRFYKDWKKNTRNLVARR